MPNIIKSLLWHNQNHHYSSISNQNEAYYAKINEEYIKNRKQLIYINKSKIASTRPSSRRRGAAPARAHVIVVPQRPQLVPIGQSDDSDDIMEIGPEGLLYDFGT